MSVAPSSSCPLNGKKDSGVPPIGLQGHHVKEIRGWSWHHCRPSLSGPVGLVLNIWRKVAKKVAARQSWAERFVVFVFFFFHYYIPVACSSLHADAELQFCARGSYLEGIEGFSKKIVTGFIKWCHWAVSLTTAFEVLKNVLQIFNSSSFCFANGAFLCACMLISYRGDL